MTHQRKLLLPAALTLLVVLLPVVSVAAPPPDNGQAYVVQADDWLSKLADKFYGDPPAYLLIFEATNAKSAEDDSYVPIADPNVIEVGQKLFIPTVESERAEMVDAMQKESVNLAEEVAVVGPSPEQRQLLAGLEVVGAPPELFNQVWLNSEPLKLADLRGKVVIVEFWTYG